MKFYKHLFVTIVFSTAIFMGCGKNESSENSKAKEESAISEVETAIPTLAQQDYATEDDGAVPALTDNSESIKPTIETDPEDFIYNLSQYDLTDDGYRMDECHGNHSEVWIYVFAENSMTYMTNRGAFKFGYYSDNLPENMGGFAQFYRDFMFQGCDPDEALENGVIYKIRMTLKPGEYCFSYPNGDLNTNIIALTQNLNTPYVGDGYYTEEDVENKNYEIVPLEYGESYVLFLMFGEEEWRKSDDVQEEFINWAKETAKGWGINID